MADILTEVDDELKRERLEAFWRQNRLWILGLIAMVILGTAAGTFYRSWKTKQNIERTTTLLEVISTDDGPNALVDYAKFAGADHAMLARFMAAGIFADQGEQDQAVKLYAEIIATPGIDKIYRDLAILLKAGQDLGRADPTALRQDLQSIAGDSNPWRFSARELLGLLEARQKNFEAAEKIMRALSGEPLAPPALKARAAALVKVYHAALTKD